MRIAAMVLLFTFATAAASAYAADPARQQEVAQRGGQVMPFALDATTHVFTKTAAGGVQQVLVKQAGDTRQRALIRAHLAEIAVRFAAGDYSAPERIHGAAMPGLAQLKAAPPGALRIAYSELDAGAQIAYTTADPALAGALHRWFDAQLSDHGHDAVAGQHKHQH
ncbi:MAG TPA: aspartate carbamoyltransferase [Burkholderiaceae bacterium]